jgi:uncharacterized protein
MSAEQAQREPTMEEILASIRRIISEEDKPADSSSDVLDLQPPPAPAAEIKAPITAPPAPKPAPAPIPEAPKPAPVAVAPAPEPKIAVFEEPEEPAPPQRPLEEELMIVEREPEPIPAPPPVAAAPRPAQLEWTPPAPPARPLVSDPVASQTAGALGRLMGTMMVSTGNTLDDVVRELLKPMLKDWLDANLSQLVEAEVAKEIDRIRRMSR